MKLQTTTLDVEYTTDYLTADEADALLTELGASPDLAQRTIKIFGKEHPVPRLTAYYSPTPYRYSGQTHEANPMTPAIAALCERLVATTGAQYNSALINVYRDGDDSIGWHADDEMLLGGEPVIASISLGATRKFKLRRNPRMQQDGAAHTIELEHGSLLVMRGLTQQFWQHSVPRMKRVKAPRINITFRLMPVA